MINSFKLLLFNKSFCVELCIFWNMAYTFAIDGILAQHRFAYQALIYQFARCPRLVHSMPKACSSDAQGLFIRCPCSCSVSSPRYKGRQTERKGYVWCKRQEDENLSRLSCNLMSCRRIPPTSRQETGILKPILKRQLFHTSNR